MRTVAWTLQVVALSAYGTTLVLALSSPTVASITHQLSGHRALIGHLLPFLLPLFSTALAIHWNIYLNYFIIRFGGPKHSATLTGMVDAVAFVGAIPYQFLLGRLSNEARWTTFLTCNFSALLLFFIAANALLVLDARLAPLPELRRRE